MKIFGVRNDEVRKNTLSEEKEGFPKHTKEAFPSIKGDSYNK